MLRTLLRLFPGILLPDVNNSSIVDKYPILPFPPYTFKLGTERFVDI